MRSLILGALIGASLSLPLHAQTGDPALGEREYAKCRACHMIQSDDGEDIIRGGKAGPNLWNVIGRKIAGREDYRYSAAFVKLAEDDPEMVWTEEALAEFITDPSGWLRDHSGDPAARSRMTFKLNRGQADLAAYLASVSPDAPAEDQETQADPQE